MEASVCVATYARSGRLADLFAALAAQTVPAGTFELVIADDGSTDDTLDVLERLAADAPFPVRVLPGEHGGAARARNRAWRHAPGDRVLFTDDDCLPTPGWIAAHLDAAATADIVVGRTGPADGEEPDGPYARVLRIDDARFFATCNVSYRRSDLSAVGGFDERFRYAAGEDTDLGLSVRARGASVVFSEDAAVVHPIRPSSLRAALRQSSRWMDIVLVVRKHPEVRRSLLHRRLFWKQTHPSTVLALTGIAASCASIRRHRWSPALAVACAAPWLSRRRGLPPAALAGTFLLDAVEVAAMVRGSIRHRTPVL